MKWERRVGELPRTGYLYSASGRERSDRHHDTALPLEFGREHANGSLCGGKLSSCIRIVNQTARFSPFSTKRIADQLPFQAASSLPNDLKRGGKTEVLVGTAPSEGIARSYAGDLEHRPV